MSKFACFLKDNIVYLIIIVVILILAVMVFLILTIPKKIEYDGICYNRLNKCLTLSEQYPAIRQARIPETYNNTFYDEPNFPYALRDFFFASSYKSYLPCGYTDDLVSYQSIANVINAGARVINLDMFYQGELEFDEDTRVIVGNVVRKFVYDKNGQVMKDKNGKDIVEKELQSLSRCQKEKYYRKYLEFTKCLEIIRDNAWVRTNAPLFLFLNLEFNYNEGLEYQIFSQIWNYLKDKLIDKYYGFQRVKIGAIPVSKVKNKIIILTNRKPFNAFLDEITNGIVSSESTNVKLYEITSSEAELYGPKAQMGGDDARRNIIENTSQNMVAVIKKLDVTPENVYNPKLDTFNYNTDFNFEVGVSMTFMNWQNYPDDNNYLKKYLEKFKFGGMVLKPLELRYIPKPPPDEFHRNKKLDYNNIVVYGLNGFMDFQI